VLNPDNTHNVLISGGLNRSRSKIFYFIPKHLNRLLCPHSLLFNRYQSSFPGVQQPGHEVVQALPANAEFEAVELYPYSP
jgi:hypothetical protein